MYTSLSARRPLAIDEMTSTEDKREEKSGYAAEGRESAHDNSLTMNEARTETCVIHENGEGNFYVEKKSQENVSSSFQRAQHTLRETEKVLSTAQCTTDHCKDNEGTKVVDRIKNRSPLKMTRSMSLRKKSRPTPPSKAEVVSSGLTEEQSYLIQISCIKALKESLEEILECIEDKDATIMQLKHELAGIKETTIAQPLPVTQSPVLRRNSSHSSRRPQSCLELITGDSNSRGLCANHEID